MQINIIDSVLEITRHRDIDSLEYSLVATFAELIPCQLISMTKIGTTKFANKVEEVVRFESSTDKNGDAKYTWNQDPHIIDLDQDSKKCIMVNGPLYYTPSESHQLVYRLIVPFFLRDEIQGIVRIDSEIDLAPHKTLIEGLVRVYSNHLFLLEESEHDKLTGLYNRRAFEKKIHRLLTLQRNKKIEIDSIPQVNHRKSLDDESLSWLAIIDIDYFKKVNDEWGHIIGDEVLLRLAQVMKASFRQTDLLFRFGGEEFVVLLEPTHKEQAHMVFERLRAAVQNYPFPKINDLTISIGYSQLSSTDFPTECIERADKALYYIKENGRNGMASYEELVEQGKIHQRCDLASIEFF